MSLTVLNTSNVDHTTDSIVQVLKQLSRWIAWSHNAQTIVPYTDFRTLFWAQQLWSKPKIDHVREQ